MDRIEELLQTPYWIIDILPMQVPKDSAGQYFAVEDYYLKEKLAEINNAVRAQLGIDVAVSLPQPEPTQRTQ